MLDVRGHDSDTEVDLARDLDSPAAEKAKCLALRSDVLPVLAAMFPSQKRLLWLHPANGVIVARQMSVGVRMHCLNMICA